MLTPAQSLALAVLSQAADDLRSRSCAIRRQAQAWFFSGNGSRDHAFAFQQICHEFGCDPVVVRERIVDRLNGHADGIQMAPKKSQQRTG
jgi:hypothetical protein